MEFLSLGPLDNVQLALIKERVEACIAGLKESIVTVEKAELVEPSQFDPVLKRGLRLS